MKFNITIDCTPDEVRQFLGLPDVKPMQAAIMSRMEAQMLEAAERFTPDAMLRSWMSLVPQTSEQMTEMFTRFFQPPTSGGKTPS